MNSVFRAAILLGVVTLANACGKQVNSKRQISALFADEMSYLLVEKQCDQSGDELSSTTKEIKQVYDDFQNLNPSAFFFIPSRIYDYKTPMVIGLRELEKQIKSLKILIRSSLSSFEKSREIAIELFYLHQQAMRYEGQKCSFSSLVKKKNQDLRPYIELNEFCQNKSSSAFCSDETVSSLKGSDQIFVEERVLKMCGAFEPNHVNCKAQLIIQKQKKTLGSLMAYYQERFKKEHYEKLFKLKKNHLKFACHKEEDLTSMSIKVYKGNWDVLSLASLLRSVESLWSRGGFHLITEIVDEKVLGAIEIYPINGSISYVPDNDNTQVYLSQSLDFQTQKKVLAHEFGHVLGFPDCYTEYFDNQTKELVYYELSSDNMNIMCSLKDGVSVPDDYLEQLQQNSCLFNQN